MKDKDILKLKFGLATISLGLLLTGSKLLFSQWTSIHLSFWLLIGLLTYFGVYRTFKLLKSKNVQIIFLDFEMAATITAAIITALATIMLLIFYPLIALLFFGLTLITFFAFAMLRFITFDFQNNKVDGLLVDRDSNLKNMTVDIHADNNLIEIKTLDRDDILILKKERFSDKVWTQLINNFKKIKVQT